MIQGRNIIGRKATSVVAVPLIRGALSSCTARIAALFLVNHIFCLSAAPSTITIIVSIAIPRVNTREKFVKKLRESHRRLKVVNVKRNDNGSSMLAISDSLKPTKISIVRNTSITVCIAFPQRF